MNFLEKTNRDKIVKSLVDFYERNGIVPGDDFACPNFEKCFPQGKSGEFSHGMQCHIGHEYGHSLKVVIVSLDCGAGGADVIEKRTSNVENAENHKNPHMKGTITLLEDLYGINDSSEAVQLYAMINSAKCCRSGSANQMGQTFHCNCSAYKLHEIELLDPQVVVFQGKHSLAGCNFKNIETIPTEWQEKLKWLTINGKLYISMITRHPSSYRYMAKESRELYIAELRKISFYIRTHINVLIEPTAKDVFD